MRKLLTATLFILLLAVGSFAQGGSAATPTLKVSDGVKTFNGVNELRVPAGCVTFSGRIAIINCTATGGGGTTSSQNGNLFFASPNGAYGLPSWRAILEADLPSINASKIGSGTLATARLGSGTASGSTYLRGDQTWASLPADAVTSIFGRTGTVVAATNDYTWAQVDKTTSSLADLMTRSAADLTSGTLATARLGTGTASSSTYLRGDQTWTSPVTSITGTANQVTASAATGAVTLSLPQSIATTSGVQFATVGVNTSTPSVVNGTTFSNVKLQIFNAASSAYFAVNTSMAGGYAGVMLNRAGASANLRNWAMESQPISSDTDSQFAISTYSDAGFPTGVLTLTRAGALTVTGTVQGTSVSLGGGITWTKGAGAPAGACTSGALYTNTSTGVLSVCQAAVWVAK